MNLIGNTQVRQVVDRAHLSGVAVEGELTSLAGLGGELSAPPEETRLDDPKLARIFVEQTGVDALAVSVGQAHLHGRSEVRLNLSRLAELRRMVPVGAFRALQCAIDTARTHHIAMVVTQRCNHAGRLGAYTQAAAEQGFIALGFCNSPPGDGHFVAPWGGREGRLSTNPMSFAVPCGKYPPILGDFSTSQTPEGKLRLYLNQKKLLPHGWIVDAEGNPSNDPADFYGPPRGAILPFGGNLVTAVSLSDSWLKFSAGWSRERAR